MNKLIVKNRIDRLFQRKNTNPILSIFYTAGTPLLDDTIKMAVTLQKAGVDMIEIGIPFSDPVADGPTIQASSARSLSNGMNLKLLMSQLKKLRAEVDIPVLLMGYFNPIMKYGVEKFCSDCKSCGIDGLIIPDLPFDIYTREYKAKFAKNNLHYIALVSPQTSKERLLQIDEAASGFIYAVSSSSTTGSGSKVIDSDEYLLRLQKSDLTNPIMVGFNIKSYDDLQFVGKYHAGGIIGSAFINHIIDADDPHVSALQFINKLKYNQ